jgi:hypothetical protein
LSSSKLQAGPTGYEELPGGRGCRNYYPDMRGIFFTRPTVESRYVGVPIQQDYYIDVAFPPNTPITVITSDILKPLKNPKVVIPAKAGIQQFQ